MMYKRSSPFLGMLSLGFVILASSPLWAEGPDAVKTESAAEVAKQASDHDSAKSAAPETVQAEATAPSASSVPASQDDKVAEDSASTPADDTLLKLRFSGGLNIRTDLGVHSPRLDFAARYMDYELDLVLDPMFWTNGQLHTDLLLQWHSGVGFSAFTGYRLSLIPLLDGPQSQHNLLLGLCADLPQFLGGFLQGQAGIELATTLVKAGGGLPAEYISFESGRSYIDLVNMALFIRLNTGIDL